MIVLAAVLCLSSACAGPRAKTRPKLTGHVQRGLASWYGPQFHGRPTANGELFDMYRVSAAHPTLPFDTWVEVRNLDNGRRALVRINDRGPFVKGRIIDLSYAAARKLEMVQAGVARVELRVVEPPSGRRPPQTAPSKVRYTVQVAAFQDEERAQLLRRRLARDYDRVLVRSDGTWHRVQVGMFDRKGAAEQVLRQLAHAGFTALIVALD